jgi:hypothetical protein
MNSYVILVYDYNKKQQWIKKINKNRKYLQINKFNHKTQSTYLRQLNKLLSNYQTI